MDITPPPQARREPTTRARARAVETEVNSFLFEFRSDSRENWILPQSETLFILRYEEVDREKEKMETRASMEQGRGEEKEKEEEDLERAVLPPTSGTTAKTIQAVLPPNVHSTDAQPDKLLCSSDPGPVLPPSPSGTTAQDPVLPLGLCTAAGLWPCIPLPLTPSWLRL